MASVYRVKGKSCFIDVEFCHVINALPFDIAHDCFEGIFPEVLLKLIKSLTDQGHITTDLLNERANSYTRKKFKRNCYNYSIQTYKGLLRVRCTLQFIINVTLHHDLQHNHSFTQLKRVLVLVILLLLFHQLVDTK